MTPFGIGVIGHLLLPGVASRAGDAGRLIIDRHDGRAGRRAGTRGWRQPRDPTKNSVVTNGALFVGVGSIEWTDTEELTAWGPPVGAVWTSPDGTTWSRVPHDEAVFDRAWINSVTVGGPGFVAVGAHSVNAGWSRDAAVWTSPDGLTWTPVPNDYAVFEPQQSMSRVFEGGPGFVGVGSQFHGPDEGDQTVMWTSVDGVAWSEVHFDGAGLGRADIFSITTGDPGLIAVGAVDGDATAWVSADGRTWSQVAHNGATIGRAPRGMSSIARTDAGFVAVGTTSAAEGDRDAVVWVSPDGINWSRLPHDEAIFGGRPEVVMSAVIATPDRLVIVGESGSQEEDYQITIWTAAFQD